MLLDATKQKVMPKTVWQTENIAQMSPFGGATDLWETISPESLAKGCAPRIVGPSLSDRPKVTDPNLRFPAVFCKNLRFSEIFCVLGLLKGPKIEKLQDCPPG